MGPRAGVLVASFALAACSAGPPTPPIIVQSEQFPQVEIECRGEVGLTEEDCRQWAEVMLPAAPTRPAGGQDLEVAKLVLTYRTGSSRCAADYLAADGRTVMTTAAACPQNE